MVTGYVERNEFPADRRKPCIYCTPLGNDDSVLTGFQNSFRMVDVFILYFTYINI
jgi:hypothetical protein